MAPPKHADVKCDREKVNLTKVEENGDKLLVRCTAPGCNREAWVTKTSFRMALKRARDEHAPIEAQEQRPDTEQVDEDAAEAVRMAARKKQKVDAIKSVPISQWTNELLRSNGYNIEAEVESYEISDNLPHWIHSGDGNDHKFFDVVFRNEGGVSPLVKIHMNFLWAVLKLHKRGVELKVLYRLSLEDKLWWAAKHADSKLETERAKEAREKQEMKAAQKRTATESNVSERPMFQLKERGRIALGPPIKERIDALVYKLRCRDAKLLEETLKNML
tara:strand:- start:1722 stop:2546 length:825 start_codon:yes stop_codon:yes gene_type:complete